MRKKRKPEEHGFNVWRSYSDMMAGVLLLFVLIMCVTLLEEQSERKEALLEEMNKNMKNISKNQKGKFSLFK